MRRYSPRYCFVLAFLLAGFVFAVSAFAQEFPSAKPESVGLSSERLDRIATAIQRNIEDKRIAGAVTLVMRHGQVAFFKAQGMADREAAKPMQRDSIFRICSMTKPITSVGAMILYEEGKFLLDDPISKYLPEFRNPKVLIKPSSGQPYTIPAKREITIRDLMRHTSGLTYNWNEDLGQMYTDAKVTHGLLQYDGTIADSVRNLAAQPLLFHPGDRWEYSLGIDVLGRLIEVWSGKPLDEFFRTRIFEPLGMQDTYFYLPDTKVPRLAAAYTYYDGKGLNRFPDTPIAEGPMIYSADYPYRGPKKLFAGGAGLVSTAMDYARFAQMILNGGKLGNARILSRKTVELMSHDQLGKIDPNQGFGIGFGVSGAKGPLDELSSVGALGWGGFFYTTFSIDPKEDLIIVFMAQLHPTGGLTLDHEVQVLAEQSIND
ncbi:MAG TPA: serine hydrolase domain-containing protein [Candidatus Dormibacteraeota bacterium]|nr:serine hydrolase domain-containing protein [Candidatus Dormibacteraeota bacterium]